MFRIHYRFGVIEMDKALESSIYEKVYQMLKDKHIDRIRYVDFYDMMANFRIKSNGLIVDLEQQLFNLGMLEKDVHVIIKKVKYYRLTLYDVGLIEKRMKEKGMIRYKNPGWLIILDKDLRMDNEKNTCEIQATKTDA